MHAYLSHEAMNWIKVCQVGGFGYQGWVELQTVILKVKANEIYIYIMLICIIKCNMGYMIVIKQLN